MSVLAECDRQVFQGVLAEPGAGKRCSRYAVWQTTLLCAIRQDGDQQALLGCCVALNAVSHSKMVVAKSCHGAILLDIHMPGDNCHIIGPIV